jgi:hypothetical protein
VKASWIVASPNRWKLKGRKVYAEIEQANGYQYRELISGSAGVVRTLAGAKAACITAMRNQLIDLRNAMAEIE